VFAWGAGATLTLAFTINSAGADIVEAGFGQAAAEVYFLSVSAPIVEEPLDEDM
jgi:hypothetical protein